MFTKLRAVYNTIPFRAYRTHTIVRIKYKYSSRARWVHKFRLRAAPSDRRIVPKSSRIDWSMEENEELSDVEVESVLVRPEHSIIPDQTRTRTKSSAKHTTYYPQSPSPPPDSARSHIPDLDPERRRERERQLKQRLAQTTREDVTGKAIFDPKAEYEKLMNTRAGGTYVPPARLRALQAELTDKNSNEYQRMAWEALKKSINGLINKVNISNIKHIIPELFGENLVRGRGLYCRSVMKAQAASLPFTPIYASLTAVVNTKLPQVGELLLTRLIVQFRKAFKRKDKAVCISSTTFLAHLCNQQVAHEIVALQILAVLLERPTDDSVEVAVGFMREVGAYLGDVASKANSGVFERLRSILHEASIDKRVQYMIEVLFQVRKDKFKDNPVVPDMLDLVEEEDQITHYLSLDDEFDVQESLAVYQFDGAYDQNEVKYKAIKEEILGEESEAAVEAGDDSDADSSEDETAELKAEERKLEIQDETNTNLTNLRKTIYLTIMSSVDFEECTHKLMKINLRESQELELCNMVIECCSQERTFSRFYGLVGERFCKFNRVWAENYEQAFLNYFETIHRYDTNKLRNIARFFAHILATDGIGWHVLSCVNLSEEETTSSSRIFIKILFQDLVESFGLKKLVMRMCDSALQADLVGLFPHNDAKKTRFAINYFTSIGLGAVTEEMREHLKVITAPPLIAAPERRPDSDSDSDSRSSLSSGYSRSNSSTSRSRSRSHSGGRQRRNSAESSKAYPGRTRSHSRSREAAKGRRYQARISPLPFRKRSRSNGTRGDSRSLSRSRVDALKKPRRGRSPPLDRPDRMESLQIRSPRRRRIGHSSRSSSRSSSISPARSRGRRR